MYFWITKFPKDIYGLQIWKEFLDSGIPSEFCIQNVFF